MIGINNPELSRKAAWLINALRIQVILEKLDSAKVEELIELILDNDAKTVDQLRDFVEETISAEAFELISEGFKVKKSFIRKSTMTDLPHPPLHPGCRCAIGLVKKEGIGQVDNEEEWEAEEGLIEPAVVEPEFDFEKYHVLPDSEGLEWSREAGRGLKSYERAAAKKYLGSDASFDINYGMREGAFKTYSDKVRTSGLGSLKKEELRIYNLKDTAETLESVVSKSRLPDNLVVVRHGGNSEALSYLRGTGASEEDLEFLKKFNPSTSKEELDPLVRALNPKIKGSIFKPTQFISTSYDPAGSPDFSHQSYKFEIYADMDSPGMISSKITGGKVDESEVVFGPSSKMEIIGAKIENDTAHSWLGERRVFTLMMHLTHGGG